MNRAYKFLLTAALAGPAFAAVEMPARAETLQEALISAYQNSPVLAAERANLRATDEGVSQALSGWRPTVTLNGEIGYEKRESKSTFLTSDAKLNPRSGIATVTQPIFRGGRTFAETRAADAAVKAGRARLQTVEQQVFLDVVTTYMNVLRDEAVVQLNINNVRVLRRQLEAAQDRFRVGEVTRTDVAQAQARLSRAISDRQAAEGNLISSRAGYTRSVGQTPGKLEPPPSLPLLPDNEKKAIAFALTENPEVIETMNRERQSHYDVRAAIARLLPTISVEGQYAHTEDSSSEGSESDSLSVSGQVTIPLYQGGAVHSQVRQARQLNNLRRIQIEDARRNAREGAVQAWESLQTARAQIKSNREQVRANTIALEGVIQEAQVGSRTTLDVLDAEQELLDAQVDLVRTERNEYVAAFTLQSALGRLSAAALKLPIQAYDPAANYSRVRFKLFGTGID